MRGVRVGLSSGEHFFVAAELIDVAGHLHDGDKGLVSRLVYVGSRMVNPAQVCELRGCEVPSIETPERLGSAD